MIHQLIKIANALDERGEYKLASEIDALVKIAAEPPCECNMEYGGVHDPNCEWKQWKDSRKSILKEEVEEESRRTELITKIREAEERLADLTAPQTKEAREWEESTCNAMMNGTWQGPYFGCPRCLRPERISKEKSELVRLRKELEALDIKE